MRYPLVDGQGNFGSVDGDPPAAYRYTEARLESLAEAMMTDLDKDTVDFRPNFDETTDEPDGPADAVPEPARERIDGHRRRHGDEHPAAQHARGHRRRASRVIELRGGAGGRAVPRAAAGDSRSRLSVRRHDRRPRRASTAPTRRAAAASSSAARRRSRNTRRPIACRSSSPRSRIRSTRRPWSRTSPRSSATSSIEGISDLRDESEPRGHADRHRAQARRAAGRRPEQPLQAHEAADGLRHHAAGDRRRAAARAEPARRSSSSSSTSGARSSAAASSSSCARPRRAPTSSKACKIALDHLDAVITLIRGSKNPAEARGRPDHAVRPDADPGAGHSRHAAPAADRPRAAEDPRRAGRAGADDRAAARDSLERRAAHRRSSSTS